MRPLRLNSAPRSNDFELGAMRSYKARRLCHLDIEAVTHIRVARRPFNQLLVQAIALKVEQHGKNRSLKLNGHALAAKRADIGPGLAS